MDDLFSTLFRRVPRTHVIVVINILSGEGDLKAGLKKIIIDHVNNGRILIVNNTFTVLSQIKAVYIYIYSTDLY